MRRPGITLAVAATLFLVSSCARKQPVAPSSNYVVTIIATGVSPTSIDAPIGSRVQFVNNDSRSHYIHSDPHPDATGCPELNQIGVLAPGQRRETGNLVALGMCGYHDHDVPSNTSLQGRINVR